MNSVSRAAASAAIAAVSLCMLPRVAAAESVSEARAQCASLKQQVRVLENADADARRVGGARREWERACARAHTLMRPPGSLAYAAPASMKLPAGAALAAPMRVSAPLSAGPLMRYTEKLSAESTAVFRGHRFKVTVLDPSDEAARLAPPVTHPAGKAPPSLKPTPLF